MYILRRIRLDMGLSAEDFGKLFGLARSTIYNYEYGHRYPSYKTAIKIMNALNTKKQKITFEQLRGDV